MKYFLIKDTKFVHSEGCEAFANRVFVTYLGRFQDGGQEALEEGLKIHPKVKACSRCMKDVAEVLAPEVAVGGRVEMLGG